MEVDTSGPVPVPGTLNLGNGPVSSSQDLIIPNGSATASHPILSRGNSIMPRKPLLPPDPTTSSEDEVPVESEGPSWTMPLVRPELLPTGLCYDVRMRYHCELDPPKDRTDYHPEDPRRIYHIYRELCQAGLYPDPAFNVPIIEKPLHRIYARSATPAEICLIHTIDHYNFVAGTARKTSLNLFPPTEPTDVETGLGDEQLMHLERTLDSIYFNNLSFTSALLSTGGAIETCKAVMSGEVKNAIAVIRPPGHHAECNRPMGFCLFDNVSVAARVCQAEFPEHCRKILILDWDVHHGNGIQQAFEQDPNVLYISIHVHENGNFYPPGPYGDHLHCGAGPGLGKNINIPWPTKGMGDADYLYAFQQVVMPVAYKFDPNLVIIAAGFDAAAGDQLGACFVSPTCYAHMTHMLMPLAKGKLVVCLEGGYNLGSIARSALAVTRTMIGEPPDRLEETSPTKSGAATVDMVRAYQRRFWPCLGGRAAGSSRDFRNPSLRAEDILRSYQKEQLLDQYDMINLEIFRKKISKSFRHQVLGTINYHKAVPLMVFFHDPYHHQTRGDINNVVNIQMYDTLGWYREWAIKEGFALIDVNFPNHHYDVDDLDSMTYDKEAEMATRDKERAELAVYLWENYIEPNDASPIYFVGVGSPCKEIVHLLNNRDTFYNRLSGGGIILFIDTSPLFPISEQNTYYLSKWFKQNSLIFIAASHA
ncbi:MAG: hypothetical protein Q9228_005412, partial [Teloschistes exilis]